ncbi:MAG: S1C family serine protease, partial [Thermoguttaceae bacterium]
VWEIAPWVVKKVGPSVVGIKTAGAKPVPVPMRGPRGENLRIEYEPIFGEGSGVIVDKDGYIITNYHVIATAQAVQIRLSDGRTVEEDKVQLIGFDEATDLAVLKIDVSDLEAIEWGNSDDVEVGETVLAIGNPFGLSHTVTQGIISAKERYSPLPEGPMVQEFLQIDAAINPGNSGGPLVNIQGELIGINTAIYGETYRGIGFAIPSSLARKVYDQIRKTQGNVKHGYMGVELEPLSQSFAEKNKLSVAKGAVVRGVYDRSPAAKADILPGDVIIKFGSHDIDTVVQLTHQIILTPPKTTVEVTLIRKGETLQKNVTLGERRMR